jgi:PAS domain S-box-containing protein
MPHKLPNDWWQLAIEKIPTAVCCVSVDGIFLWANLAWLKMLGYGLRELQEKSWRDITVTQDVGADQASVDLVLKGVVDEYWIDKTYICRDGSELPAHLYVHRYPLQDKVECFIVSATPNHTALSQDLHHLEEDHVKLKSAFMKFVEQAEERGRKSISSSLYEEIIKNKVIWLTIVSVFSFFASGIWAVLRLLMGG